MRMIAVLAAGMMALGACASLTSEDRIALREAAVVVFMDRIDLLKEVVGSPEGVSDTTLLLLDTACITLQVGAPFITEAINRKLAADNADLPVESQISAEEFTGALSDLCTALDALLRPAPIVAPLPPPAPVTG